MPSWALDNLGGGRIKGHGDAARLAGTGRGVLRIREHEGEAADHQAGAYRGASATDQVLPPGDPSHVSRLQTGIVNVFLDLLGAHYRFSPFGEGHKREIMQKRHRNVF